MHSGTGSVLALRQKILQGEFQVGVMTQACNPTIGKWRPRKVRVQGQPQLQEGLSKRLEYEAIQDPVRRKKYKRFCGQAAAFLLQAQFPACPFCSLLPVGFLYVAPESRACWLARESLV